MISSTCTNNGINKIYKVLFILFIVIGVYYPSLFSQFNSIDDTSLITYLEDTDFNLFDIIIPGGSHYYRPVIWLTFFFDKYAWGLEPSFMHLENIIIHGINAVLVYTLASSIANNDEQRLELPLLAALLFAVHPINTEAVCWVAGRTDPLATFFILAAAYYLARNGVGGNLLKLSLPAACIFLGCLTKEVAFFFFPIAALVAMWRYRTFLINNGFALKWQEILRPSLPFIFFPLVYIYLRQSALSISDKSVVILTTQQSSIVKMVIAACNAFGFYAKKLLIPLPLNFAIVSYSKHYLWLGIAVIVLAGWLCWQNKLYNYILGTSLFLILPAVVVAIRPIAWTPIAERYLYAPSAFFAIAFVGILNYQIAKICYGYLLLFFLMATIIVFSFLSVQRNIVWQDNYLLYQDAVAQSPQFSRIRNEYGIALALRGKSADAFSQFSASRNLDSHYSPGVLNLANVRLNEGKYEEALAILAAIDKGNSISKISIHKATARVYESMLFKTTKKSDQKRITHQLIEVYHYIYLDAKNPYVAYRSGQLLLMTGDKRRAAEMFARSFRDAPNDAFYKAAAKKLADKYQK